MTWQYVILCLAALAAGAINSVAGGGTLLTFPALFAALGSGVLANGTSTVALVPGAIAALYGFRREIAVTRHWVWLLILPSLAGGAAGALLVTSLEEKLFERLVPWLILTAATLLALQPTIARWTGVGREHAPVTRRGIWGVQAFQFLVAVYGGYFGAGIGILMLSGLAMMGLADIHRMNAVKSALGLAINGVAVVVFVANGKVHWPFALAMMAAAAVGGFLGASISRRLDKNVVRRGVVLIGFCLAAYYFYRQWAA